MEPGQRSKPEAQLFGSSMDAATSELEQERLISRLISATIAARRVLSIFEPEASQRVRIGFEELGAAFEEITCARATLEKVPADSPDPLSKAVAEYRAALEQLRPHLPRFEGWLSVERARLADRRTHAASVSEWADATLKTR